MKAITALAILALAKLSALNLQTAPLPEKDVSSRDKQGWMQITRFLQFMWDQLSLQIVALIIHHVQSKSSAH